MGIIGRFSRLRAVPGEWHSAVPILCAGFILFGSVPVIFRWSAETPQFFQQHPALQWGGCALLALALGVIIVLVARLDSEPAPWKFIRHAGFVLIAALLTDLHFYDVDVFHMDWQWEQFAGILAHVYPPPDQYRFLSQGTLWWLMLGNGNFVFSYLAYRFFFTFLLCQCIYKLSRLYLDPLQGFVVVLLYAVFYPLSTRYYYGNLCDPTSHAVMLAALVFCQRRQFWPVFWLMTLGVFIKETMLIVAPCWLLMDSRAPLRRNYRGMLGVAGLAAAGAVAFLVCRLPFHFHMDFQGVNRTVGPMIWSNLGFGQAHAGSMVSVFQRYLHPVLFLFMWFPFVLWYRRFVARALLRTAIYLSCALYLVNLFFSWNYESRNFVPGLVVLLVCAMSIVNRLAQPSGGVSPA